MNVQLPDGQVAEFPAGMPQASIEAAIRQQFPPIGAPQALPAGAGSDAVGRLKAWATKEPPAGDPRANVPARVIRAAGDYVLPGSAPSAVAMGASLVPGVGPLATLGRLALGTGGGAAVETLRGGDPLSGALEAGSQTAFGEVLGAGGRAVSRAVLAKIDPLTRNVASVIGNLVPSFRGATPRSTIVKALGSEGTAALQREYGNAVNGAIAQAGDPIVKVGGLVGPASQVWRTIKSEKRLLLSPGGEATRKAAVFQKLDNVHQAEDAFAQQIEAKLPAAAKGLFVRANQQYREGREIQRLFNPSGTMTPAKVGRILTPAGKLDQPTLSNNLTLRFGKLQETFGPEKAKAIQDAILRGAELGVRDVPGRGLGPRFHFGVIPTLHPPRAPRLVGRPEATADDIASALRRLGVRAAGETIDR